MYVTNSGFIRNLYCTDRRFQEEVRFAMENINRLTKGCIKFVPRTNQRDYLVITSYANKCFAAYGRYVGLGPHKVFLGPMCREQRTILHELVHTLGFVHEQSRTDRDRYVTILYQNIINGIRSQFSIDHNTITYGVPYDYESIVHYSQYEFSMNGGPTIITKVRIKERCILYRM
ncbi:Astacin-like metalloendopeptidase [Armadillidium vulgare]|nr:Astacin-like metalloendopeptidase [Armadillidium vulgare]